MGKRNVSDGVEIAGRLGPAACGPKARPRGVPPTIRNSPPAEADHGGSIFLSRFIRPEAGRPGQITDRDLDILDALFAVPVLSGRADRAPGRRQRGCHPPPLAPVVGVWPRRSLGVLRFPDAAALISIRRWLKRFAPTAKRTCTGDPSELCRNMSPQTHALWSV